MEKNPQQLNSSLHCIILKKNDPHLNYSWLLPKQVWTLKFHNITATNYI